MLARFRMIFSALILGASVASVWNATALAQANSARGTGPTFLVASVGRDAPVVIDASAVPVLRRRVTLALNDASLDVALRTLADKANLHLSYSRAFVPLAQRVNLDAKGITVAAALTELLLDAGVDVVLTPGDRVTLVQRAPTIPPVQNGSISGRVVDATSRSPIASATIRLDNELVTGRTRSDGTFRITEVTPGSHVLHVRMLGYTGYDRRVEVNDGGLTPLEISLERSAFPLNQVVVTGPVVPTELKAIPNAMTLITAKQIEERGITKIEQLFRGDVPGLFALNTGSSNSVDEVLMFSRGATALTGTSAGTQFNTNPIKTYVDGVELADPAYINQIDPSTIERIEILTGPQASTIYGSNALNGVMQVFTKRGTSQRPNINASATTGIIQNNVSTSLSPTSNAIARISRSLGAISYDFGGSVDHVGAWTPAKKTTRYSGSAGVRVNAGPFIFDGTYRRARTQNDRNGDFRQVQTSWREMGLVQPNGSAGISAPTRGNLDGETIGLTVDFNPTTWWTHELVVGTDNSSFENQGTTPAFITPSDSLLLYSQFNEIRASQRYTTSARIPFGKLALGTLTFGADHWRSRTSTVTGSGTSIDGSLTNPTIVRDKPGKNTGGFLQAQLAFWDQLFLTYGLRGEWNPNYGEEAQPNYAPRYGVAYTRQFGDITAKLRGAYGRSTRPPAQKIKLAQPQTNAVTIGLYGNFDAQIANPDLGPEFQGGIEAGLELYLRNRASLQLTRYNQTIDNLIVSVFPVDSVRSLAPNPQLADSHDSDGFGYLYIKQNLNVGSIRNQGWELLGSLYTGFFTTRATYSWTKSRVIGLTPAYRNKVGVSNSFIIGASFDYLPEHTWSLTETFANRVTTVALALDGHGQFFKGRDYLFATAFTTFRDPTFKLRQNVPANYRPLGPGHAMIDLNIAHRFMPSVEAIAQVQNLTNYYQADQDVLTPAMGRVSKIGLRVNY